MSIRNQHYEVLGVSVGHARPVENTVHVELNEGVQAVYGLNGAGKTWILKLIQSALTGVRLDTHEPDTALGKLMPLPVAHTHFCLTDLDDDDVFRCALTRAISEGLTAALAAERGEQLASQDATAEELFDPDEDALETAWLSELAKRYIRLRAGRLSFRAGTEFVDQLLAVCDEGVYTLVATGTTENPAWDVWISSILDTEMRRAIEDTSRGESLDLTEFTFPQALLIARDYAQRVDIDRQHVPEWLPFPLFPLGCRISIPAVEIVGGGLHDAPASPGAAIQTMLAQRIPESRPAIDEQGKVAGDLLDEFARIEDRARTDMQDFFPGINLQFLVGSPAEWFTGQTPQWVSGTVGRQQTLPTSALSDTQHRWASLVTDVALLRSSNAPMLFLCDEPERGLHVQVARKLPEILSRIGRREGMAFVVSTHSHYMLANPRVHAVHADRSGGTTAIRPTTLSVLDAESRQRTQLELSLSAPELNTLMNVAIVIEGIHDEIVFRSLLREPLDRSIAGLFPMHGAKAAHSLAEARLLLDGTDVDILVVLDNLDDERIAPLWRQAVDLAEVGAIEDAQRVLTRLRKGGKNSERKYLHQLGDLALSNGCLNRIRIVGLTLPDIVCYLPEEKLFPQRKRLLKWDNLIHEWREHDDPAVSGNSIKDYLTSRGLFPKDETRRIAEIERSADEAANSAIPVHPELVSLGEEVVRTASQYRSRRT